MFRWKLYCRYVRNRRTSDSSYRQCAGPISGTVVEARNRSEAFKKFQELIPLVNLNPEKYIPARVLSTGTTLEVTTAVHSTWAKRYKQYNEEKNKMPAKTLDSLDFDETTIVTFPVPEYYMADASCSNCHTHHKAAILKGTDVQEGLKDTDCPNCGLKRLS